MKVFFWIGVPRWYISQALNHPPPHPIPLIPYRSDDRSFFKMSKTRMYAKHPVFNFVGVGHIIQVGGGGWLSETEEGRFICLN